MQHPTDKQSSTDFTATSLDQYNAFTDPSPPRESVSVSGSSTPQSDKADPLVRSLASKPARGIVQGWWLVERDLKTQVCSAEKVEGAIIRTPQGKTSPIAAIDPSSRRVETLSGSVYALGMPEVAFAAKSRLLLRRLGF